VNVLIRVLALCFSCMLVACSHNVAGGDGSGSGSETTNSIAGVVLNEYTQPVRAQVILHKVLQEDIQRVDSTWSDAQGRFTFVVHDSGQYALQMQDESKQKGRWVSDVAFVDANSQPQQHTLASNWNWAGRVDIQPGFDSRVIILGTPWQTNVDSLGNWELKNILPGSHIVLHQVGNILTDEWVSIASFSQADSTLDSIPLVPRNIFKDTSHVLLDDFDDMDDYNLLGVPWWTFDDGASGGTSQVTNSQSGDFVVSGSEERGGIIDLKLAFGESSKVYAGVGTNFYRPAERYNVAIDLRSLDSIRFAVRGQNVQVSAILLSPLLTSNWAQWSLGELSNAWTTVTLSLAQSTIAWPEGSPFAPSVGGNLVDEIIFVITPAGPERNASFGIDQIEFIKRP
jgi:hypothetical protein